MWERLRRFSYLEPEARGLFWRAGVLLSLVCISLRVRGFRRTQIELQKRSSAEHTLGHPQRKQGLSTRSIDKRKALSARMVCAAARYLPWKTTCLEQSLALWFILNRHGIVSELRIGTRKTADQFEAHAWVECDGEALNETREIHQHYAAFEQVVVPATEAR